MAVTFPAFAPRMPVAADWARLFGHPGRPTAIILATLALFSLLMPALIVSTVQPVVARALPRSAPVPIASKARVPVVDPVDFAAVAPADARAFNAMIPFSTAPNPAAKPFVLKEDVEDKARAIDCMAAAVLYEAGDDAVGERAVAQVILNRVRHPAFPKSICGVVFQGAERSTGCQFTFTCDGALFRHRWSDAAWGRARDVARLALGGSVFAGVGHATHYHTDWVVPYWSASLDKITAVGSHLFFRWTGWWGTPPAFNRRVETREPVIPMLAALSPAHQMVADGEVLLADGSDPSDARFSQAAQPLISDVNIFLVLLDPSLSPDDWSDFARFSCGERSYCKFIGWTDRFHAATRFPLEPFQSAGMAFSYLRDKASQHDKALWNCHLYPRADARQCMKLPVPPVAAGTTAPAATGAVVAPAGANLANSQPGSVGVPATTGPAAGIKPGADDGPPPPFLLGRRDPTRFWPNRNRIIGRGTPARPLPDGIAGPTATPTPAPQADSDSK